MSQAARTVMVNGFQTISVPLKQGLEITVTCDTVSDTDTFCDT